MRHLKLVQQKARKKVERGVYRAAKRLAEILVDWSKNASKAEKNASSKPSVSGSTRKKTRRKTKEELAEELAKEAAQDEKARKFVESLFEMIEQGYFSHPKWFVMGTSFLFFRILGTFGEVLREVVKEKSILEREGPGPGSLWSAVLADLPTDEAGLASYCSRREAVNLEKAQAFLKGILKSVPRKYWAMVLTELSSDNRGPVIYWLKQNQMYPPV